MNPFQSIDNSLRSLEKLLNVHITLVDNHGIFRNDRDQPLFPAIRLSHKKNMVCRLGFCNRRCIGHCRFDMIHHAQTCTSDYFVHECWKGLMEVVVPLRQSQVLYGLLYAGIWRVPGQTQPHHKHELPRLADKAYAKLDAFDQSHANTVGRALTLVGQGIVSSLENLICKPNQHENRKNIIKQFVMRNAANKPKLTDLARELGLSLSRSSHVVKEIFGKSLEEMVMAERVERAGYLLQTTDLPVGKIAEITGFPDAFSFTKLFKRSTDLPPTQYRKQFRNTAHT